MTANTLISLGRSVGWMGDMHQDWNTLSGANNEELQQVGRGLQDVGVFAQAGLAAQRINGRPVQKGRLSVAILKLAGKVISALGARAVPGMGSPLARLLATSLGTSGSLIAVKLSGDELVQSEHPNNRGLRAMNFTCCALTAVSSCIALAILLGVEASPALTAVASLTSFVACGMAIALV